MVLRKESLFQVYLGFADQIMRRREVIVPNLNLQNSDQRYLYFKLKHSVKIKRLSEEGSTRYLSLCRAVVVDVRWCNSWILYTNILRNIISAFSTFQTEGSVSLRRDQQVFLVFYRQETQSRMGRPAIKRNRNVMKLKATTFELHSSSTQFVLLSTPPSRSCIQLGNAF